MNAPGNAKADDFDKKEVGTFPLASDMPLHTFTCTGNSAHAKLQNFLLRYALPLQTQHLAHTTVAIYRNKVIGYITYGVACVRLEPKDMEAIGLDSYDEVPCLRIVYLAVANGYRRLGVGELLLDDALEAVDHLREKLACRLVVVNAYTFARGFYEHYQFKATSRATQTRNEGQSRFGTEACTYMYLDLDDSDTPYTP